MLLETSSELMVQLSSARNRSYCTADSLKLPMLHCGQCNMAYIALSNNIAMGLDSILTAHIIVSCMPYLDPEEVGQGPPLK